MRNIGENSGASSKEVIKRTLKNKASGLLLVAGWLLLAGIIISCTHQGATDTALPDGLYFLSDTLTVAQAAVADRFSEEGYSLVDKQAILHLKDTKIGFEYDARVYADSFAILHFETQQDWDKLWLDKDNKTARQKVGLVVKDELMGWTYSNDLARSRLMSISYCDWPKEELTIIEKNIRNDQKLSGTFSARKSPVTAQAEPISYHPQKYQEQVEDTALLQADNLWVRIKKYPLMDKGKEQVYTYQGGSTERVHFREMLAAVTVGKADALIFEETVGVSTFAQIEDKAFLDKAVLTAIWFDSFDSLTKQVVIHCNICVPDTDWCYFFALRISTQTSKNVHLQTVQLKELT